MLQLQRSVSKRRQRSTRSPANGAGNNPLRPFRSIKDRQLLPLASFDAAASFAAAQAGWSKQQTMSALRGSAEYVAHIRPWSRLLKRAMRDLDPMAPADLFALWNSDVGSYTLPVGAFRYGIASKQSDERASAIAWGALCDQRKAWLVLDALNESDDPNAWAYYHARRLGHSNWVMPIPTYSIQGRDANGASLLHWAARRCPSPFLKFLIDQGVSAAAVDRQGNLALHEACRWQSDESYFEPVTDLLLQHGISVNAPGANGASALHIAAKRGSAAWCSLLLARGADPGALDRRGRRPLECVRKNSANGARGILQALRLGQALGVNAQTPMRARL